MTRATLVGCVVAVLAAGCATRGSVRQVAEDLQGLQAEVGALRRSQDDLSRRIAEVAAAGRNAQAGTAELGSRVAVTTGEVERLAARAQAAEDAIKDVKETLAAQAAAPPPASPPPAPAEPPRTSPASSAETTFAAGVANFRNREYGQAVLDFLEVVSKHPSHELAPAAQYWIGEAYYLQRDYRQALVEFQRSVEWPSPNAKAADALLKSGLCLSHLREATRAQGAWRRVVREFPGSPAAEEARLLLAGKIPPATRQP
jgi:tol-pal system protein YbgF